MPYIQRFIGRYKSYTYPDFRMNTSARSTKMSHFTKWDNGVDVNIYVCIQNVDIEIVFAIYPVLRISYFGMKIDTKSLRIY